MKGSALYGRGNQSTSPIMQPDSIAKSSAFQKTTETETEAEFLARMKKEGGTMIKSVEAKGKDTTRDNLVKKIKHHQSGTAKKGYEQSVKSSRYQKADEILAKKGNTDAAKRLKARAAQQAKVKKAYAKNPDMTRAEIDKMMSQQ